MTAMPVQVQAWSVTSAPARRRRSETAARKTRAGVACVGAHRSAASARDRTRQLHDMSGADESKTVTLYCGGLGKDARPRGAIRQYVCTYMCGLCPLQRRGGEGLTRPRDSTTSTLFSIRFTMDDAVGKTRPPRAFLERPILAAISPFLGENVYNRRSLGAGKEQ